MLHRSAAVGDRCPDLRGGNIATYIGHERNSLAVGGPGDIAEPKIAFHCDLLRRPATDGHDREFSIGEVSDPGSIGRKRNLADPLGVRHGIKHCLGTRRRSSLILREKRDGNR